MIVPDSDTRQMATGASSMKSGTSMDGRGIGSAGATPGASSSVATARAARNAGVRWRGRNRLNMAHSTRSGRAGGIAEGRQFEG